MCVMMSATSVWMIRTTDASNSLLALPATRASSTTIARSLASSFGELLHHRITARGFGRDRNILGLGLARVESAQQRSGVHVGRGGDVGNVRR